MEVIPEDHKVAGAIAFHLHMRVDIICVYTYRSTKLKRKKKYKNISVYEGNNILSTNYLKE